MTQTENKNQLSVNFCFCCFSVKSTSFFTFFLTLNIIFSIFSIGERIGSLDKSQELEENEMVELKNEMVELNENNTSKDSEEQIDRRLRMLNADNAQKVSEESVDSDSPEEKFEISELDIIFTLLGELDKIEVEILNGFNFDESLYNMLHLIFALVMFTNNVIAMFNVCRGNYGSFFCMIFAYFYYICQLLEIIFLILAIVIVSIALIWFNNFLTYAVLFLLFFGLMISSMYFYWSRKLVECYKHHNKLESKEELIEE